MIISHALEKKELGDREASEEASLGIFQWFVVGAKGAPSEKIYHDGLLHEMWVQEDGDSEEHLNTDHQDSQESVLKDKDALKDWLSTIGDFED